MNQCILTGRLTKDVEIRYFNDKANVLFTLAVDSGYKDKSGNPQVDFISCQAWNGQAEFLSKILFYYAPKLLLDRLFCSSVIKLIYFSIPFAIVSAIL